MEMELQTQLTSAMNEEKLGHEKYLKMAELFKEKGYCNVSRIFKDMAMEEKSHANILSIILEDK